MINQAKLIVTLLAGITASGFAQSITAVNPSSAAQGTSSLTITFTLSATMLPPAGELPESVTIGTLSGSSLTHATQGTVTAEFDFPFSVATGSYDAVITFAAPSGPPPGEGEAPPSGGDVPSSGESEVYTMTDGFTVTAGVDTPPSIIQQPTSLSTETNSSVYFAITASGSSPMVYQWQKDMVNLVDGSSATYTIDPVMESDVGDYRCIAANSFGTITSAVATLTISARITTAGFTLTETGQTGCYDTNGVAITAPAPGEAFAGQDAQYNSTAMVYQDNGNGTVTDLNTGLMWQQVPSSESFSWQQAADYCNALALGGYTDWRMPSCKELFAISDFSDGWPYLNANYFHLASGEVTKDEQFWASDYYVGVTVEGGSDAAFGVNHVTGHIKAYAATVTGAMGNFVRAVRGNSYGENQFQDNGDGTITDNASGLMWQQADDGIGRDWPTALAYAEGLELGGYRDWRLPNIKELQSILDYTKSPTATNSANLGPAIDTDYFSVTQLPSGTTNTDPDYGYYWSSTSAYFSKLSPGNYYAWYIAVGTAINDEGADFHGAGGVRFDTMADGGPAAEEEERIFNYVLCVRGGAEAPDTDSDSDGLTDWYEYNYSSSTTNMAASADDDEDGASNEDEQAAGTVPTDASSKFELTGLTLDSDSQTITWSSELNMSYAIQRSTNLISDAFTTVATGIKSTMPANSWTDTEIPSDTCFYRVIIADDTMDSTVESETETSPLTNSESSLESEAEASFYRIMIEIDGY